MTRRKRTIGVLGAVAMLAGLLTAATPAQAGGYERTYEITIENLTDNQVLTPAVVATHSSRFSVFRVGRSASHGLQQLAENGGAGVLADELDWKRRVADVEISPGPIAPGAAVAVQVTAPRWASRVSVAAMLICTNDGFGAVSRVRLPRHIGQERSYSGRAYDAGTEINTQDFDDLVPPCSEISGAPAGGTGTSNPALAENGVVRRHRGILSGVGDLTPANHGWRGKVIKVTIERIG